MGLIAKEMSLLSETWSSYRDPLITFVLEVLGGVPAVSLLACILVAPGVFFDWTTKMTFKTLATAACIALSSATASLAAPINLDFTVGGVSGTFYGLDDEIVNPQAASSFDLFTPTSIWTDVDMFRTQTNSFVFSSSVLFSFDFWLVDDVLDDSLTVRLVQFQVFDALFIGGPQKFVKYVTFDAAGNLGAGSTQDVTLENFTIDPISPVPLPAGGLLLLSGLAGVVALKRRKKRTA